MIDNSDMLPAHDATPSLHISWRAQCRLCAAVLYLTPDKEECAIYLQCFENRCQPNAAEAQNSAGYGAGRLGSRNKKKASLVEVPSTKVAPRATGAQMQGGGSSKRHFDVLDPSSDDVVIAPARRNDQAFGSLVVLLQPLAALFHLPRNPVS